MKIIIFFLYFFSFSLSANSIDKINIEKLVSAILPNIQHQIVWLETPVKSVDLNQTGSADSIQNYFQGKYGLTIEKPEPIYSPGESQNINYSAILFINKENIKEVNLLENELKKIFRSFSISLTIKFTSYYQQEKVQAPKDEKNLPKHEEKIDFMTRYLSLINTAIFSFFLLLSSLILGRSLQKQKSSNSLEMSNQVPQKTYLSESSESSPEKNIQKTKDETNFFIHTQNDIIKSALVYFIALETRQAEDSLAWGLSEIENVKLEEILRELNLDEREKVIFMANQGRGSASEQTIALWEKVLKKMGLISQMDITVKSLYFALISKNQEKLNNLIQENRETGKKLIFILDQNELEIFWSLLEAKKREGYFYDFSLQDISGYTFKTFFRNLDSSYDADFLSIQKKKISLEDFISLLKIKTPFTIFEQLDFSILYSYLNNLSIKEIANWLNCFSLETQGNVLTLITKENPKKSELISFEMKKSISPKNRNTLLENTSFDKKTNEALEVQMKNVYEN
jgi:hypothetical protein